MAVESEAKVFAIMDKKTGTYYQASVGKTGWYAASLANARTYTTEVMARSVINAKGQHVIYPGNRQLIVVLIQMKMQRKMIWQE